MAALSNEVVVMYCDHDQLLTCTLDRDTLVVLDYRTSDSAETEVIRHRLAVRGRIRCLAIARLNDVRCIRAITLAEGEAIDVIVPAFDSVVDIIKAHINDPTRSVAAAATLDLLFRALPVETHGIIKTVVGSGFAICTVKQLAASLRVERSSVGKALRRHSWWWTPTELIDLVRASFAVLLLSDLDWSANEVAHALHYSKVSSLDDLLMRALASSRPAVGEARLLGATDWLEHRIRLQVRSRLEGSGSARSEG
jgi:AraC-like DNA-binding protein